MSIRRRTEVIVRFQGGSEFQQTAMRGALMGMIITFKAFYEQRHKKNQIEFIEREWKGGENP